MRPDEAVRPGTDHHGFMRRLLPDPVDDITVEEAYGAPLGVVDGRPWVGICMVASIDGSIAVDGTSAQLSSPTDTAVLAQLRRTADAILVGAGTVRDEGYGPPQKSGQRIGVVTNSGRLDYDSELFTCGAAFVVTGGDFDVPDHVDVLRAGRGDVDLAEALRLFPQFAGDCGFVQAEGGAALNGALLDADVVDEINLNTSPAVFGADGPRLTNGAPAMTRRFEVAQLGIDDEDFVYTRWLRRRG